MLINLQSIRSQIINKTKKCPCQDLNRVLHDWNRALYQLSYQPLTDLDVFIEHGKLIQYTL
jgi:hypothetical protein